MLAYDAGVAQGSLGTVLGGEGSLAYAAALSGGGYLQAPPISAYNLGTGDFTVEAWVRTAAAGGSGTIIARKDSAGGPGDGGFLLVLGSGGSLKFATDDGFGYFQVLTGATAAADGTWHHVAGVRQGAGLTIYLDGIAQAATPSGNRTPPLNISSGDALTLGTTAQTQEPYRFLTGQLDAVTMWTGARSAAQVAADMRTTVRTDPGLIGYWTFDNQNGADSSPSNNTAVAVGTVGYVTPGAPITGPDYAARLGASGTFTAPSNGAYQLGTGDFTVGAWLRTASPGGSGTVIARKGSQGGPDNGGFLLVLRPDGSLKLATDNGSGYFQGTSGPTGASEGRWHHVAGVRQGATVQLYLDGLAIATSPSGNATPPLNVNDQLPLTIGTTQQSQEQYQHFGGDLAAVTLWGVARDAASVSSDMHTVLTGTEAGLIGFWPFSFRNGLDLSPTGNNATAAGSVSYVTPGAPIGWFAALTVNQGYLQAPPNAAYQLGTGDFTLEAWVRTAAAGGSGTLIARKGIVGGPGDGGFLLVLRPDGTLKLATDDGFGFFQVVTSATTAGDGNWHFVAAVRQGAGLSILVDGQSVAGQTSGTRPPPLNVNSGEPLTIAVTLQTQEQYRFLSGQLDAVALWRGARSQATIAADMNTRFTGLEAGLLGFWGFDFRDGRDTSPAHGDAAVNGNVTFVPPGAPIGQGITVAPVITSVADDGQNVTVIWTPVQQPLVTGYRMTLFEENGQPVSSAEGSGTSASVPAPPQGSYYVQAQALGTGIEGPWSSAVVVVTAMPANLAVAVTDTAITASWSAAALASGYRLALLAGGSSVETSDGTTTTGQLAIPADHTPAYTVSVRGQIGSTPVSTGPWSPAIPVLLAAPALVSVGYDGATVQVQWNALSPPPPDGYTAAVFAGQTQVASAPSTGTSAQITVSLDPAIAYVVRVQALADHSSGLWSAPVAIVTAIPSGLTGGAIGGQVAARWQAAAGQVSYEAAAETNGTWGAPQPAATPAITFAGAIAAGAIYAVRARIVSGISSGPWSASVPGPFLRSGTVSYDGIGRLTSIDLPGVATTSYTYDAAGNITEVAVTTGPAT